jgi:putative SOS response-associated peptidase YedK
VRPLHADQPRRAVGLFDGVTTPPDLKPRYNVAPTQTVPVVRHEGKPALALLRWGIVPSWAAGSTVLINARSETAATARSFSKSFRERRCLVLADGFLEWKKPDKSPVWFRRPGGEPFAFAGIWEGDRCAVLTVEANGDVRPVHDRMPAILAGAEFARWIDPDAASADLQSLLRPRPDCWLEALAVSRRVNSARNDDPDCLEPESGETTGLFG